MLISTLKESPSSSALIIEDLLQSAAYLISRQAEQDPRSTYCGDNGGKLR